MEKKNFFKSVAFKCIITLLCIVLVSGILLTFCNALFKVTDEERLQRAINKIYGKEITTTELEFTSETQTDFITSEIVTAYLDEDGNYLVESTGKNGYGGPVTCYVVVKMSADKKSISGVGNVVIKTATGESYISNITSAKLEEFSKITYTDDKVYELGFNSSGVAGNDYIATGASYSMRAISNAVNGAISFVKVYALGAVVDTTTPYDDYAYTDYIDKQSTTHTVENGVITYVVVTQSNGLHPNPYTFTIQVNAESKAITSYEVTAKGGTYGYEDKAYTQFSTLLAGKTASDIMSLLHFTDESTTYDTFSDAIKTDATLNTGATESNFLALYAALFATSNVENATATEGGNN
jgi:Na+-translocating ferredoxin:NAD+ oxidoreductase RnfG subunit